MAVLCQSLILMEDKMSVEIEQMSTQWRQESLSYLIEV